VGGIDRKLAILQDNGRESRRSRKSSVLSPSFLFSHLLFSFSQNKDLRLFSRFYRVGFYGPLTEELDGKEFIYKRDQKVNLAVVQQQLKDIFSKKAKGVENIIVLPNKDIEREKLDPTKFYLQIANVELYSDPDENRVSAFDRNFNVNRFIFEAAFATTGKAQTETSQQQKKKIVFQSELAFPYLRNRLEVQDKKEIVLSPIENAVELIAERIQKLRVELNSRPARLNSLQQVLQGSVVPSTYSISAPLILLFLLLFVHLFFLVTHFLLFLQW
jgi:hypothetical protein